MTEALDRVSQMQEHDAAEFARLRAGELRIVHKQRARKLRRKGTRVWFHQTFCALVWEPDAPRSGDGPTVAPLCLRRALR